MFTLAGMCNCWMRDINSLAAASVSGLRGPPPAEYKKSYCILSQHIWQKLEICSIMRWPQYNLVLFEKPALDSRKLASQKGNNLILSNLDKGGQNCNPLRALWLHMCTWLYLVVCLYFCFVCALMWDCLQLYVFVSTQHKGFWKHNSGIWSFV